MSFFLFKKPIWSTLCCSSTHGCGTFHWLVTVLPGAPPLKKTESLFHRSHHLSVVPQLVVGTTPSLHRSRGWPNWKGEGMKKWQTQEDTRTQNLAWGGLCSLMEKPQHPEAQCADLYKRQGLLLLCMAERVGGVCGVWMNKETGLANLGSSGLCSRAAFRP